MHGTVESGYVSECGSYDSRWIAPLCWGQSATGALARAPRNDARMWVLDAGQLGGSSLILDCKQPVCLLAPLKVARLGVVSLETGGEVFSVEGIQAGGSVTLRFVRGGRYLLRFASGEGGEAEAAILVWPSPGASPE